MIFSSFLLRYIGTFRFCKKETAPHAGLAQLFRARPCQGRGQGLESPDPHHDKDLCQFGTGLFLAKITYMAPWRSSYAAVCKTVNAGANPVGASIFRR